MNRLKRIFTCLIALLIPFTMVLGACGKSNKDDDGNKDNFPYYKVKENMKMDGQLLQKEGIEFPASLWQAPEYERYETGDKGNVKAYFINSYNDNKVFCYVGIPENASKDNKVPAMVLVHGATGTAFDDWVSYWVDKGYAAIAMDTEGRMPGLSNSTYSPHVVDSVRQHGPLNAAFNDCELAVEEQWAYNAIAAVISSRSFIGSFEAVDNNKVGICGVSYGAWLTCLNIGYDDRYQVAVPVYGCLDNTNSASRFGTYFATNQRAIALWDTLEPLEDNETPTLFVIGNSDTAFALDSVKRCAKATKYGQNLIIPGFEHGHCQLMSVDEIYAFVQEVMFGTTPLIRFTSEIVDGLVTYVTANGVKLSSATVFYTLDDKLNTETEWLAEPAQFDATNIYFNVDPAIKHYFVLAFDEDGNRMSSLVS